MILKPKHKIGDIIVLNHEKKAHNQGRIIQYSIEDAVYYPNKELWMYRIRGIDWIDEIDILYNLSRQKQDIHVHNDIPGIFQRIRGLFK